MAGIGAVLFHILSDGSEKPIAYASRTLSKSEANYSQIEGKLWASTLDLRSFIDTYMVEFVTDHKPLVTIFGPTTSLSIVASTRVQRWAIVLSLLFFTVHT